MSRNGIQFVKLCEDFQSWPANVSLIISVKCRYIILPFTMSTTRWRNVSAGDKQWFPRSGSRNRTAILLAAVVPTFYASSLVAYTFRLNSQAKYAHVETIAHPIKLRELPHNYPPAFSKFFFNAKDYKDYSPTLAQRVLEKSLRKFKYKYKHPSTVTKNLEPRDYKSAIFRSPTSAAAAPLRKGFEATRGDAMSVANYFGPWSVSRESVLWSRKRRAVGKLAKRLPVRGRVTTRVGHRVVRTRRRPLTTLAFQGWCKPTSTGRNTRE